MPKKEKAKFTASETPSTGGGMKENHGPSFPAGHAGERASFVKGRGSNSAKPESKPVAGRIGSGDSGSKTKPAVPRAHS